MARFFRNGKFTQLLILLSLTCGVLWILSPFFAPLITGGIFAVVFFPLYQRLLQKNFRPWVASLTIVAGFSCLIIIPSAYVTYKGAVVTIQYVQSLLEARSTLGPGAGGAFDPFHIVETWGDRASNFLGIDLPRVREMWSQFISSLSGFLLQTLRDFIAKIPDFAIGTIIILAMLYFGLIEFERIKSLIKRFSLLPYDKSRQLFLAVRASCQSVLISNVVTGLVQAGIVGLGCLITGAADAVIVGFLTFLASFVPAIGAGPIAFVVALIQFAEGDTTAGVVMVVVSVIAGVADNVVRPMVASSSAEIHPFFSFLSIIGGILVFGLPGLFIGPLIATLFALIGPHFFDSLFDSPNL